jgi:UDP-N-acetylglucosamine 2-epimerase (non-hydrolysing)
MAVPEGESRRHLLVVVGTRPEAIKLVPLILALERSERYEPIVLSTGQHEQMVGEIFALAGITVDAHLWVGGARSRLNERVATLMQRLDDYVCGRYADLQGEKATLEQIVAGAYPLTTLVHGDTSSAFAAALASFHLRIPVVHVEAGLRTGGLNLTPFPEELNRQLITCIAAMYLAPTAKNEENLVRENVSADQVFVTGNTGIDALHWAAGLDVPIADPRVADLVQGDERIVLVTAHRRENWGGGLAGIAEGVARVASSHPDVWFVLPMHPNPVVRAELRPALEPLANVHLAEPLRYTTMAKLLARCEFVITDSGGLQEEAPSLDKPVLVARDSTERTEGVEAGTLRLVGTDPERVAHESARLLDDPAAHAEMADAENPYGDGRAAERIVAAFEHLHGNGPPPTPFGPGYTRSAVLTAAGYDAWLRPLAEEEREPSWVPEVAEEPA